LTYVAAYRIVDPTVLILLISQLPTSLLLLLPLQVSIVRYRFRENCTEAKYAQVLAAFNAWQPWKLSKEHAMAEVQCGYDQLQAQVRQCISLFCSSQLLVAYS
jgi:hypothetical protein